MNTRWFCLASLLLCLFSASESSRAQGNNSSSSFCIYPSVWFPKMKKSDLLLRDTVGSGLTLGQEIDLEKDFGVRDGPRTFPGVRVCLGYRGSFFLRGGYQELNFAGNSAAGGPLEIAGYTIQPGSRVDVSTRFDFFEVGLESGVLIRRNQVLAGGKLQQWDTFLCAAACDAEEIASVCLGEPTVAFGDVGGDGQGGTVELVCEEEVAARQVAGEAADIVREGYGFLIDV